MQAGLFKFIFFSFLFFAVIGSEYLGFQERLSEQKNDLWPAGLSIGMGLLLTLLLVFAYKRAFSKAPSGQLVERFLKPALTVLFCVLVLVNHSFHPQTERVTADLLVLMIGILCSLAAAVWKAWFQRRGNETSFLTAMLAALIVTLAFASLFHPDWSPVNQLYEYRGIFRWSGPFKNPNQFGVLMALGLVLACGLSMPWILRKSEIRNLTADTTPTAEIRGTWSHLPALLLLLPITVALIKSYSRGAWLGAFLGLGYLAFSLRTCQNPLYFQTGETGAGTESPAKAHHFKISMTLFLITISVAVLCFWFVRDTEIRPVRRLFSIGNMFDFSWRNRVEAYVGALRILRDNPWFGLGWHQSEAYYDEYYCDSRLTEGSAIVLNDYLSLGMALGLPALLCFMSLVWLSLHPSVVADSGKSHGSPPPFAKENWVRVTCRAGLIVLLTGIWFDRGLFMLCMGIPFWLLLECGREHSLFDTWNARSAERERPQKIDLFRCFAQPRCALPLITVLVLCGTLMRAEYGDPLRRFPVWFKAAGNQMFSGMVVLPRPVAKYPVAIYTYAAGSSPLNAGMQLRQIAELGFGAISFEYDQENQSAFNTQSETLFNYLHAQSWAQSNVVWISSGTGVQRTLGFLRSHPTIQPQLIVAVNNGGWRGENSDADSGRKLRFDALLNRQIVVVRSQEDPLFTTNECMAFAGFLRTLGASVRTYTVPGTSHTPEVEYPSVLRAIAEYAEGQLPAADYASALSVEVNPSDATRFSRALFRAGANRLALWRAVIALPLPARSAAVKLLGTLADDKLATFSGMELSKLVHEKNRFPWRYLSGIGAFVAGMILFRRYRRKNSASPTHSGSRSGRVLRGTAFVFVGLAAGITALHLLLPRCQSTEITLSLAKKFITSSHAPELDYLAQLPAVRRTRLDTLLTHVRLSDLQRTQFYTNLNAETFQHYILSPEITAGSADWNWRKTLWENFLPRIRKEHDPLAGAQIVVEHLREKVGIDPSFAPGRDIAIIWMQQMTDAAGFQKIYAASLRSVGIAARLNKFNRAELWNGQNWNPAPPPRVTNLNSEINH